MAIEPLSENLAEHITDMEVVYDDYIKTAIKGFDNIIFHARDNKEFSEIKYFDQNGIVRVQRNIDVAKFIYTVEDLRKFGKPKTPFIVSHRPRYKDEKVHARCPSIVNNMKIHGNHMFTAVHRMMAGETFLTFIRKYNLILTQGIDAYFEAYGINRRDYKVYSEDKELNRFIRKINRPIIERENDNKTPNTFDFIRIRIGIPPAATAGNRKQFVESHMDGIIQIVLNKLRDNGHYQRYGVPVEYLKLDHAGILVADELELVFCLKGT